MYTTQLLSVLAAVGLTTALPAGAPQAPPGTAGSFEVIEFSAAATPHSLYSYISFNVSDAKTTGPSNFTTTCRSYSETAPELPEIPTLTPCDDPYVKFAFYELKEGDYMLNITHNWGLEYRDAQNERYANVTDSAYRYFPASDKANNPEVDPGYTSYYLNTTGSFNLTYTEYTA